MHWLGGTPIACLNSFLLPSSSHTSSWLVVCALQMNIECSNRPVQTLAKGITITRWAAVCCLAIGQLEVLVVNYILFHLLFTHPEIFILRI
jgi:hypothetical protein